MAKEKKMEQIEKQEMTADEAKAFRATLAKPEARKLTDRERREAFRVFWAKSKKQYGKSKDLEQILWVHLKAVKMDQPETFEDGIKHFGLKKVK
jgi:hypothetical protein